MVTRVLFICALVGAAFHYFGKSPSPDLAAATAPLPRFDFSAELHPVIEPIQESARGLAALRIDEYVLTPVARFQVAGRVLGARHYRADREADLAPVDLAMGWGPMTDPAVLAAIDISQGGRFYRWRAAELPIPAREISRHSANMHLIPADPEVAAQLTAVDAGSSVRFKGYLVKIDADDGWRWRSTMTRTDQGAGACEVVLVDTIEVL